MSWRSLYHKIDISDIKKGSEKEMIEFTISSLSAFLKHTGLTYRVLSIFPHNLKTNYINRPEYCTPMKINRNMFLWIDMGKIKKVTITAIILIEYSDFNYFNAMFNIKMYTSPDYEAKLSPSKISPVIFLDYLKYLFLSDDPNELFFNLIDSLRDEDTLYHEFIFHRISQRDPFVTLEKEQLGLFHNTLDVNLKSSAHHLFLYK